MPPLRLAVLHAVRERPDDSSHGLRRYLDRPRTTVEQTLQALHALGLVNLDEIEETHGGNLRTVARYRLAESVNTDALDLMGVLGNVAPRGKWG
jgi:predicted transcriptional regulator